MLYRRGVVTKSPKPGAVRALLEDIAAGRPVDPARAQGLLAAYPAPPVPVDPPPSKPASRRAPGATWPAKRAAGPSLRGRWSRADLFEFERLFGTRPLPEIAKRLCRPVATLRKLADKHFPLVRHAIVWTLEHEERFTVLYGAIDDDLETVARALRVPVTKVDEERAARLRDRASKPWTLEDDAFLKKYFSSRTTFALSVVLSRFEPDIEARATHFALSKDKAFVARLRRELATGYGGSTHTPMPRWTKAEIRVLRERYADTSNVELARELKKSQKSVVSKAHHLGLKKSAERLAAMGSENVALRYQGTPCPTGSSSSSRSL